MSQQYDQKFFNEMHGCPRVAKMVTDLILPSSVIDIACGNGSWLRDFAILGAKILGIDEYCDPQWLVIPKQDYIQADIFNYNNPQHHTHDLCVCVEFAEHIPEMLSNTLVKIVTEQAPVILWSAAIPGQGGVNHQNCQWPDYWQTLFRKHNYQQFDIIRSQIWFDKTIEWWYRQNLFLYIHEKFPFHKYDKLSEQLMKGQETMPFRAVHPENLSSCVLYPERIYPERHYVHT